MRIFQVTENKWLSMIKKLRSFLGNFVDNKAKRRTSKWGVIRKQTLPNISKNEDFLPPDMHKYVIE